MSFLFYHKPLPKLQSYQQDTAWQKLQAYLPKAYQLNQDNLPTEWFWQWKQHYQVHIDHYPNPQAKAKIILLHGVGTHGRQMSLILGQPLAQQGYETFAIDLPGYGLSVIPPLQNITYPQWIDLVNDFIHSETRKDPRPIFLYGLSAGGMLTLHVASINPHIKGIIGMTFLDQQHTQVQKGTMRFSALSTISLAVLKRLAPTSLGKMRLPMALVSKMYALANQHEALKIMLKDPRSAGNSVSLSFLDSYMHFQPRVEISNFSQCPVLLTQPEDDRWTPLAFSQPVLTQLKVPNYTVILPQGGHYPLEESALETLLHETQQFIEQILAQSKFPPMPLPSDQQEMPRKNP